MCSYFVALCLTGRFFDLNRTRILLPFLHQRLLKFAERNGTENIFSREEVNFIFHKICKFRNQIHLIINNYYFIYFIVFMSLLV